MLIHFISFENIDSGWSDNPATCFFSPSEKSLTGTYSTKLSILEDAQRMALDLPPPGTACVYTSNLVVTSEPLPTLILPSIGMPSLSTIFGGAIPTIATPTAVLFFICVGREMVTLYPSSSFLRVFLTP